jgi:hypothetical protein
MLSHQQNSRSLCGLRCTGCGEAQSRELVNSSKNVPVLTMVVMQFLIFKKEL